MKGSSRKTNLTGVYPRLGYWLDRPLGRSDLYFALDSELVYFDRDFGTTGGRFDLYPKLYWHRFAHWGFIKPSLGYRYTSYDLDRMGLPGDESPKRRLPHCEHRCRPVF